MLYDITQPLLTCSVYPGDPVPAVRVVRNHDADGYQLTELRLCTHNGTHIDAPLHFDPAGLGVGALPPEWFVGPCVVVQLPRVPTAQQLLPLLQHQRLLFKGDFSLTAENVALLKNAPCRLLGTESQTLGDLAAHRALLGAGKVFLEGLVLGEVPPGEYMLSALPLNLAGSDGSPVRAVLWDQKM